MECFIPAETQPYETRVSATPGTVRKLKELGLTVKIESGAGLRSEFSDEAYREAGADVTSDRTGSLRTADIVLRVRKPSSIEVRLLKPGSLQVSFLDPFAEKDLLNTLSDGGVSAISVEMIPRTTLAQKMDALSSQANIAGYAAVIAAAERLDKVVPMMMTPAGTISPARVFVIGVGVAGLQAIATAKRLGARTTAFDTRPVVEEQVKSLGAKFLKIDLGETGQTAQGYAKELTPEQIEKQRQGMARTCAQSDIVITTAKLFGRPAPKIVTADMIAGMRSGSVVVDLAAESGGNVDGTRVDKEFITDNGVRLIGLGAIECRVARDASEMYASNLYSLLAHFWDRDTSSLKLDREDPILAGCLLTHGGQIVHEKFRPEDAPPVASTPKPEASEPPTPESPAEVPAAPVSPAEEPTPPPPEPESGFRPIQTPPPVEEPPAAPEERLIKPEGNPFIPPPADQPDSDENKRNDS